MATTSPAVNVLRYSALVFGIFYGFQHQRQLNAQSHAAHVEAEWKHKESLIEQAKKEWKKKTSPDSKGDGVITDPDDKNFDLEAFLKKVAAEN